MRRLEMDLSDAEADKLVALAKARRRSVEQCIHDFIATCQPGGSGWEHPEKAAEPKASRR